MSKIIKTKQELINLFKSINAGSFISMTTETVVKMKKTNNPYVNDSVTKVSTTSYQFGYSYENAVNNRIEKNGSERIFESQSLPWGQWFEPNKIIENKGKLYARCYNFLNNPSTSTYYINGLAATESQVTVIKSFLTSSSTASNTQSAVGLTTNQVEVKSICFESIKSIRVNNDEYIINVSSDEYKVAL